MRQGNRLAQHMEQVAASASAPPRRRGALTALVEARPSGPSELSSRIAVGQPMLDQLQIPVAQLAIHEVVQPKRGVGEIVVFDSCGRVGLDARQAGEDPAVLDGARQRLWLELGNGLRPEARVDAKQRKASRVEQLVGKRLALLDLLGRVAHVLRRGHRQQAEAHRVGAMALDLLQRVDPGAQ